MWGENGSTKPHKTSMSPTLYLCVETCIILQTAQGLVSGLTKSVKVRVLFDSGSRCSFVRSKVVQGAGLVAKRREWLDISNFGQKGTESGPKEVYELEIVPLDRKNGVKIEAYAVDRISSITNDI